jgi:hypothetical protein
LPSSTIGASRRPPIPGSARRSKVRQWGFYAGDLVARASEHDADLRRAHRRADVSEKPNANPQAEQLFGFATDVVPNQIQVSPRAGFNWDISGNGTQQIRGGAGLFSGRPAYVWISNQYGNTGIDFTRIGAGFNTANRIRSWPIRFSSPRP